jgi:hypothetical protein
LGLVLSRACSHKEPARLAGGEQIMLERLERHKKLTTSQCEIIATANVGDMLDFFDFSMMGMFLALY